MGYIRTDIVFCQENYAVLRSPEPSRLDLPFPPKGSLREFRHLRILTFYEYSQGVDYRLICEETSNLKSLHPQSLVQAEFLIQCLYLFLLTISFISSESAECWFSGNTNSSPFINTVNTFRISRFPDFVAREKYGTPPRG